MLKRIKTKYLTYASLNIGGDHVSSLIEEDVKHVAKGTGTSLTSPLYKHCIEKTEWPTSWKKGERKPIFKKGDRRDTKTLSPSHFSYSS